MDNASTTAARLNDWLPELANYLATLGFQAPSDLLQNRNQKAGKLAAYIELLERWTSRVDLVSPAPTDVLVERHVIDCAAGLMVIRSRYFSGQTPEGSLRKAIDIGSGAGLPGLIWAMLSPELEMLLVEPREKRVMFLREVVSRLGLKNVTISKHRMDEVPTPASPEFGLITSRAVGGFDEILKASKPFVAVGGLAGFMVGPSYELEPGTKVGGFEAVELLKYSCADDSPDRAIGVWRRLA